MTKMGGEKGDNCCKKGSKHIFLGYKLYSAAYMNTGKTDGSQRGAFISVQCTGMPIVTCRVILVGARFRKGHSVFSFSDPKSFLCPSSLIGLGFALAPYIHSIKQPLLSGDKGSLRMTWKATSYSIRKDRHYC